MTSPMEESKRTPATPKPTGRGRGRSPPPFPAGFGEAGGRLDPAKSVTSSPTLTNMKCWTSGLRARCNGLRLNAEFRGRVWPSFGAPRSRMVSGPSFAEQQPKFEVLFEVSEGIPKWFLGQEVFGGLGHQSQTKTNIFYKKQFAGSSAEGGKANKQVCF